MSVAINLNTKRIWFKDCKTPREKYILLKKLWYHNSRLRCYEFPVIALGYKDEVVLICQSDWYLVT